LFFVKSAQHIQGALLGGSGHTIVIVQIAMTMSGLNPLTNGG
jgi:hypothetical protein